MGEFNSDDHYIYYCGQESPRINGVAIMVNKRFCNAVPRWNLKNDSIISIHFQGKPLNIMVIQTYAPTSNAEKAEVERFYEDLQDLLELTPNLTYWVWKAEGISEVACTGRTFWPISEAGHNSLMWEVPFLIPEERSILISEDKLMQRGIWVVSLAKFPPCTHA